MHTDRHHRRAFLGAALAILVGGAAFAADFHFGPRQYYGPWHKHPTHSYFYRPYFYKPRVNFAGYRHHYVIHFPRRPQYHYFYNPYQRKFWGRCPVKQGDEPKYSMLTEKDRKAKASDIPESAFPEPGPLPEIPESTDGGKLDLPPDDLPEEETPED